MSRPALLIALLAAAATAAAGAPEWEKISDKLFAGIEDYQPVKAALNRKIGCLAVAPPTGDVFVMVNRTYGVWKSPDAGETWTRLDSPVRGRAYGGFAADVDPATGRLAVFSVVVKGIAPVGGLTLDGGRTWTPIGRPEGTRHDGWSWGCVAWGEGEKAGRPQVILAKQHHAWVVMWLSVDGGRNWRKIRSVTSRNPGLADAGTLLCGVDEHSKGAEKGIFRSTDGGESWRKVADHVVTGKTPVRCRGKVYWTTRAGVIASDDRGETWTLLGGGLPGALWGPYFSADGRRMVVVNQAGFQRSDDGGATWRKVADFFGGRGPGKRKYSIDHPTISYGWDAERNILYCAPVGGEAWRLRLGQDEGAK